MQLDELYKLYDLEISLRNEEYNYHFPLGHAILLW